MRMGRAERMRVLATAGLGLASVVWAVAEAARGEWEFYALAIVLTVATNLTVVEMTAGRSRKALAPVVNAAIPEEHPAEDR